MLDSPVPRRLHQHAAHLHVQALQNGSHGCRPGANQSCRSRDEAIGIGKGDAQIEFKFDAEDDSLNIDEIYLIEVARNPAMHGELYADKKPGESITVLGLTSSDAKRMKQLQLAMAPFRNGDVKGSGSLRVNLSGMCLHSKMPPGEVQLDVFLQTSEQEGFFLMANNLDMREVMAGEGSDMDELPDCGG